MSPSNRTRESQAAEGAAPSDLFPLRHSYARLPEAFHSRIEPTPVAQPSLIRLNRELVEVLGLDPERLSAPEGVEVLAGNRLPDSAEPLAMVYGGHQFGNWVPQLGDGRAILLGEVEDREGRRRDVQLKGAGRTPYSRGGDGRSSIGPVVREYLGSEALAALGIPTTRALAAVATGESVLRGREEPGGILVRVARSHVRVGTFEYFAHRGDTASITRLADYVIGRHFPHLEEREDRYLGLLEETVARTADLVASWLLVGFIHGVMNTDNTSIVGETIDYGPFGFLDPYRPDEVYSSIDRGGRYAYGQQPGIAQWNLTRLAETLLPLLDPEADAAVEAATEVVQGFSDRFFDAYHRGLVRKIGFRETTPERIELAKDLLQRMSAESADMTLTFRELSKLDGRDPGGDETVRRLFSEPESFDEWSVRWRSRLEEEGADDGERRADMQAANPAFILRNHLAQAAVDAAIEELNFGPMERLLTVLSQPYTDQPEHEELAQAPAAEDRVTRTFCGT